MISSAPSSRVLLLSAPVTAADAASGAARIRRYRLARVRAGSRPAAITAGAGGLPNGKARD